MERAYFFFGDDVVNYVTQTWADITEVQTADAELKDEQDRVARGETVAKRRAAMNRITQFYSAGQPLFARYMRFSQPVPASLLQLFDRIIRLLKRK